MDQINSNHDRGGALTADLPARPTGWRKYLRFPKSWAEVRKLGWRFVLAFVLFYLIRDTILYLIIPYLIYKGILGH